MYDLKGWRLSGHGTTQPTGRDLPYTRSGVRAHGTGPPSGGFHSKSTVVPVKAAHRTLESAYIEHRPSTSSIRPGDVWRRLQDPSLSLLG